MAAAPLVNINIRNIAFGGDGVGEVISQSDGDDNLLGIVAFVPFVAPGEVVSARVQQAKEKYVKAELISVDIKSEDRVSPPCPYFGVCGGCELQHLSYPAQSKAKLEMLQGALRSGRLKNEVLKSVEPLVPSEPYMYRRRITLHVDSGGRLGFYRSNSRSVVAIERCEISVPAINATLLKARQFAEAVGNVISSIMIEADDRGVVVVLKTPESISPGKQNEVLTQAKKFFENAVLMIGEKEVGGFGRQIMELSLNDRGTTMLKVPAGHFSQVNWDINKKLVAAVVEAATVKHGAKIYDLYAGAGNFALPLARAGAKVIAVECDPRLVVLGRDNSVSQGFNRNLEFVEGSVEKFLREKNKEHTPDVLILDPPRSGLGQLASELPKAEKLILVSCQLPSFVRDLRALTEEGWNVERIVPFDMFAQTSYLEIMTVLVRQ